MEKINEIIRYFQDLSEGQIIDIIIAIGIILIFCLFSSQLAYFIVKIFKWKEKEKQKIKENAFYKPLKLVWILIGIILATSILKLSDNFMKIFYLIIKIMLICIFAKGITNIFAPNSILMKKIGKSNKVKENEILINFLSKTVKAVIYTIAGFLIISSLGFNLNGLIAGLGLGSVVVALAAQDLAKSLFAGLSILLDKPFVVGDWIETKTYSGTVVDITFKSTRIKTVEDSIVTIQNSTLSEETIVNYAKMNKRRYSFNIKLPLQTNSDTVEKVMTRIRFILNNNKDIIEDSTMVECNNILLDGINIVIVMYTSIIPYNEYMKFRTKINKDILNIIESEGIRLANPTQDIYVKNIEEKNDKK